MNQHNSQQVTTEIPFLDHIKALRNSVFRIILAIIGCSIFVHFFHKEIIVFLQKPLGDNASDLQFLSPTDPLFFIIKIDFILGFLIALPFIVFIVWRFISPAVEQKSATAPYVIIITSTLLSLLAGAYAYKILVPIILVYMTSLAVPGTTLALTANGYLNFLLSTTVLLILVFQIPLVIVGLTQIGVLNPYKISKNRSYVYTGLFIISAIITPTTDVITLMMIAVPAILVLEIGTLFAKPIYNRKPKPDSPPPVI